MSKVITWSSDEIQSLAHDDGDLSPELCEAMSLPESNEGIIILVRITHDELKTPILISSWGLEFFYLHPDNREPVHGVTFKNEKYIFCPFSLSLLGENEGGELQSASISISNVDPNLTKSLRNISNALDFSIILVRRGDLTREQMKLEKLKLTNVTITVESISGQLSDYDYFSEPITPNYTLAEYRTLA